MKTTENDDDNGPPKPQLRAKWREAKWRWKYCDNHKLTEQTTHDRILINFWIKWLQNISGTRARRKCCADAVARIRCAYSLPFSHIECATFFFCSSHSSFLSFFFCSIFCSFSHINCAIRSLIFVSASLVQLIIKLNCSVNIQQAAAAAITERTNEQQQQQKLCGMK